jgi:peptidyl-prolyl cis-trans isomerase C
MYEAQVQLLEPQMESESHVRHILAPTREAIDRIAAELKTGVDFAVLAARRSSDEATRLDGGDRGYLTADETSPEFARVIREVPEGGVSRPFEDEDGWHIVKIEDVRKRRPPSIDELDAKIRGFLKAQQLEEILKDLRADAEIVKRNPARSSRLDAPAATAPARVEPAAPKPAAPEPVAPAPDTPQGITILPMEPAPAPSETRDPSATPATPQ